MVRNWFFVFEPNQIETCYKIRVLDAFAQVNHSYSGIKPLKVPSLTVNTNKRTENIIIKFTVYIGIVIFQGWKLYLEGFFERLILALNIHGFIVYLDLDQQG